MLNAPLTWIAQNGTLPALDPTSWQLVAPPANATAGALASWQNLLSELSADGQGGPVNDVTSSNGSAVGGPGAVLYIEPGATLQLSAPLADDTVIAGQGTLDLNGQQLDDTISLVGFAGTLTNSSPSGASFAGAIAGGAFSITNNGGIELSGAVVEACWTMQGAGKVALSGTDYAGAIDIESGTVQLNSSSAIASGALTINGGTLDLDGQNAAVDSLAGSGGQIVSSAAYATLTVNNGATNSYHGNVNSNVGLVAGNGYGGSSNGYGGSSNGYGGSSNGYGGSSNGYGGSSNGYGGSSNGYGGSSNGYGGSSNGYGGSSNGYGGSSNGYGGSSNGYGGSSNGYGGSTNGYGGSTNGYGGSSNGYGGSTNGYGGSTNGYGGTPGSGGVIDIEAGTTYQLESAPTDYTLIEGSGTLDLNGQFADATVTLQDYTGTIVNSSSNVATFAASIQGGNFTIAGSNTIKITGTLEAASITMNGTGELVFNTGPSSLAALTINSGEVQMQSTLNVAGGTLTVNGGEIDLFGRDAIVGNLAGTGGSVVNSYVTLASTVTVTNANGDSYQGVRQADINWDESGIDFHAGSPNGPQITNFTVVCGPDVLDVDRRS